MAVSRVVMNYWGKLFKLRMEQVGLTVYMATSYVNDLRYVISLLDLDTVWDSTNNCWSKEGDVKLPKLDRPVISTTWNKDLRMWDSTKRQTAHISKQ